MTESSPASPRLPREKFRAAYAVMLEQISRRRFGLHERHVLRLVNECSFGMGRYHATIPKLDYFVQFSRCREAGGVMERGHSSVAVRSLVEKEVLQIVSPGVYRLNVVADQWKVPLLPDPAKLLEQLELLEPAPDLDDELLKTFVENQQVAENSHFQLRDLQNLPDPGAGFCPPCPDARENANGSGPSQAFDQGHYRDPESASSTSPKADPNARLMAGRNAPSSSAGQPEDEQRGRSAQDKVGEAVLRSNAEVTNFVTPAKPAPAGDVTKNVTLAKKPNNGAGSSEVTNFVTLDGPAAISPVLPLASPSSESSYTDEACTNTNTTGTTHNAYKVLPTVRKNVTVQFDNALWQEVMRIIGKGKKSKSYRPWWRCRIREDAEKVRIMLKIYRDAARREVIENPGGYMMGIWRQWQEDDMEPGL